MTQNQHPNWGVPSTWIIVAESNDTKQPSQIPYNFYASERLRKIPAPPGTLPP